MMKGAEAILKRDTLCNRKVLKKIRIKKKYRNKKLDVKLRQERTKTEARILYKAKKNGVLCPLVYFAKDCEIYISLFKGKTLNKLRITKNEFKDIGVLLSKLHSADIIHSDYTTANIMRTEKGTAVIDFGLSYISKRIEDKANDIVTLIQELGVESAEIKSIIQSYVKNNGDAKIVQRAYNILKRGRYHKFSNKLHQI